jgi:6-phosphogluconolactonase (cycloisomerase 2 family)
MEFPRTHRPARCILTPVFALGLVLGSARAGSAQPTGALVQLPRPDACTQAGGDGINCRDGIGLDSPADIAVSPDGKSVYVPSFNSSAVAVFARDPASGALTQLAAPEGCVANVGDGITCQEAIGLFGAGGVAVSPDSAHVYVASGTSSSVTVFVRDESTGALTQLPEPDGCVSEFGGGGSGCTDAYGPIAPTRVLVSADGKYVYTLALNGAAIGIFARDKATGKLTQLPAPEGCIAASGDGVTCKGAIGLASPRALALSRNGKHLYVASQDGNAILIFERSKTTGTLTQLDAPNGCVAENGDGVACIDAVGLDAPTSVVVARNGRHVYVASFTTDGIAIFERDPSSGALTQLPAPNGCLTQYADGVTCTEAIGLGGAAGVTQSKNGRQIYVASAQAAGVTVFDRDKTTGVLTQFPAPYGCALSTGDGITCRGGLGLSGARSITVTKNGKHVYVASFSGDAVAAFVREK